MKPIELLAPAKNRESGEAAINYGADAVYIGADKFGARASAGNPIADIESLIKYAHQYRAKVFVTLNTILYDRELKEAEKLIHQIYNIGADALIIQDMGILKMDLPPIPLHASTQTNNFDPERIKFLDQLGFERIVLARELSIKEITEIRKQTNAELEFFVHGALCVSLSGQCYFSQAITGRSANRGECAQMCRHPYNLLDAQGNRIKVNSHLLSLKDLNNSNNLKALIDAGICSLKIEGRLKDINYVKNVVSYYRQKLDELFNSYPEYCKASSGQTDISFTPDPEKSFNRFSTNYFLDDRQKGMVNQASPKSMGKRIGKVMSIDGSVITIDTDEAINNGDGLCFIKKIELSGVRVEKVVHEKIYLNDTSGLKTGTEIYRNYDHQFIKQLDADKSKRKINAEITVEEGENTISIILKDEDGLSSQFDISPIPEEAIDPTKFEANVRSQLSKSGDSIFTVSEVDFDCISTPFFRMSELNQIRRDLFAKHTETRISAFIRKDSKFQEIAAAYPKSETDFSENISNKLSEQFYKEHGVETTEPALEVSKPQKDQTLMTTRYCIKYELGHCPRFQNPKDPPKEPLFLEDQNRKYRLEFDCKNCLMKIKLH